MPTQKSFDQLLINMNLYQQAKNLAISLFIFSFVPEICLIKKSWFVNNILNHISTTKFSQKYEIFAET